MRITYEKMEDKKTRQRHCKEMVQLSAQFTSPRAGEEKRTVSVYLLMIAFLFSFLFFPGIVLQKGKR